MSAGLPTGKVSREKFDDDEVCDISTKAITFAAALRQGVKRYFIRSAAVVSHLFIFGGVPAAASRTAGQRGRAKHVLETCRAGRRSGTRRQGSDRPHRTPDPRRAASAAANDGAGVQACGQRTAGRLLPAFPHGPPRVAGGPASRQCHHSRRTHRQQQCRPQTWIWTPSPEGTRRSAKSYEPEVANVVHANAVHSNVLVPRNTPWSSENTPSSPVLDWRNFWIMISNAMTKNVCSNSNVKRHSNF